MTSPNDLPNPSLKGRRLFIVGGLVAAAVLTAGGTAAAVLASGGDEPDATIAHPTTAPTTAPASPAPPPAPPAGKVRLEATRLVDGKGDARADGGGKAPAWADLTEVSWQRSGEGATVVFTAAAAVPTTLPAGASASYGTYLRQNDETVFVAARLDGETWRVRVSDTGKPTDLEVTPRVSGNTVAFDLPGEVGTAAALVDVSRPAKVRAVSTARMSASVAFTDICTGTDSAETEADW